MQSFAQHLEQTEYKESLVKLAYVLEQDDILTENVEDLSEGLDALMSKLGLTGHQRDGLVSYITKFTTGAGKLLVAAIKGDKKKVKAIASGMNRAHVVDFLLKLDMATMHIVTGPIHMIDAITGWELMADVKGYAAKASTAMDKVKAAYKDLKKAAQKAFKKNPEKYRAIKNLGDIIPI